jgi:uncharacterized protein (TIGR02646 family)
LILVPRTAPPPDSLRSKAAGIARGRASRFFKRPERERRQDRHRFDKSIYAARDVRHGLVELFHGKCAYCESPPRAQAPFVDHFRPTDGALALDGTFDSDHYWWLAYEWENLYLVCPDCAQAKGGRFPVSKARPRPGTKGDALSHEGALLLDPCADDPETHLVYAEDGYVSSGTANGSVTIDVLSLNRWWLVMARGEALEAARREWDAVRRVVAKGGAAADRALDRFMAASHPYAGIRMQFGRQWLSETQQTTPRLVGEFAESAAGKVTVLGPRQRALTREEFEKHETRVKEYSVAGPKGEGEHYYLATRSIARIEIENFRIIRELVLDFPNPQGAEVPWLMLIGENSSGKSSILQAATLALMGDEYRERVGLDPRRTVRRGSSAGSVTVHLNGVADPIEMTFTARSRKFRCKPSEPKVLLLGYGATRLLPRPGPGELLAQSASTGASFANVDNLFDPHVALKDPVPWLMSLDEEHFDGVARSLKGLLPLSERDRLVRSKRRGIEVNAFGTQLTLDELSDGYQSVIALATDMMQVLMHRWEAIEPAEGIVAIDEVEAHLHPRWRMRIVSSLRRVFPRLQFLTTSHDPLCLRGLLEGEAVVMRRRPRHEVFAVTDLPPVQGLRVDQLLTSEIFGLNSTSDPEVDKLLDEYRELRWRRSDSAGARRRREELRQQLDQRQLLGRDRRERLVLEAADEYLAAERRTPDSEQRRELRESTKTRIAQIFAEAVPKEARKR